MIKEDSEEPPMWLSMLDLILTLVIFTLCVVGGTACLWAALDVLKPLFM